MGGTRDPGPLDTAHKKSTDGSSLPIHTPCWSSLGRIPTLFTSLFLPYSTSCLAQLHLSVFTLPHLLSHRRKKGTLSFPTKRHTPLGQCFCQPAASHPVPTVPGLLLSPWAGSTCWGMPTSCMLCWPGPFRERSTHFEGLFWWVPQSLGVPLK